MLNIRGMSIVENLLTGVNRFGQGLKLRSPARVASVQCTKGLSGGKLYQRRPDKMATVLTTDIVASKHNDAIRESAVLLCWRASASFRAAFA